jgi:hypothetical protein
MINGRINDSQDLSVSLAPPLFEVVTLLLCEPTTFHSSSVSH